LGFLGWVEARCYLNVISNLVDPWLNDISSTPSRSIIGIRTMKNIGASPFMELCDVVDNSLTYFLGKIIL